MGYPGYPPPPPPPRNAADVTVSIFAMLAAVLGWAMGALMGLFSLAFLDHCPPATCSVAGAVNTVVAAVAVSAMVVLVGLILTIVRLTERKTAWPFAIGMLLACVVVFFLGAVGYAMAVS